MGFMKDGLLRFARNDTFALVRTLILGFLLTFIIFPARAADPLESVAKKLSAGIKAKKSPLVAVLNFTYPRGRMSTGSFLVSERLVTYLVQDGVPVVERRLISSLLEEKKLRESGVIDPKAMKEIGQVLGVDNIVVGALTDISEESTEVVARAIRIETGEILAAGKAVTERLWSDFPRLPAGAQGKTPLPAPYFTMGFSQTGASPDAKASSSAKARNERFLQEHKEQRGRFKLAALEPAR